MFTKTVKQKSNKKKDAKEKTDHGERTRSAELSWKGIHEDSAYFREASARLASQVSALSTIGSDAVAERNLRAQKIWELCQSAHTSKLVVMKASGETVDSKVMASTKPPYISATAAGGINDGCDYIDSILRQTRQALASVWNENRELVSVLRKLRANIERGGAEMVSGGGVEFTTSINTEDLEAELGRLGLSRIEELEEDACDEDEDDDV